jgi:uncharacterized protein DUF559
LLRYSRQVLIERRRALDLTTRAAAGLLLVGPEAALTTHTAALMFGCSAADRGTIHVLSRYHRKVPVRPGLALHQTFFDEDDVVELDGMRTLCLEAVITELLCTAYRPLALACADQALASLDPEFRGLFHAEVDDRLTARLDRRGTRRARPLLALATGLPESPAESFMLFALYDAGLPMPTPQFSVRDIDGHERYRLDFAWEEPKIALEYDGYEAHEGRQLRDARRDNDLRARGWLVIRAGVADLRDPRRVAGEVRAAFAKRRYAA